MVTNVGTSTIAIDHVDGLFLGDQNIYLEDLLLNVTHDLKAAPYVFTSEIGIVNNRFLLRYTNTPLNTIKNNISNDSVYIYNNNQKTNIVSVAKNIKNIYFYDVLGRELVNYQNINAKTFSAPNTTNNQVLIVKVIFDDDSVVTKKIIN